TPHETRTPHETMTEYFRAWRDGDHDALRAVLADDVDFVGAMGAVTGGDAAAEALMGLARITKDVVVQRMHAEGEHVITWFDLYTTVGPDPLPVANWTRVRDGRARRIRVTFDPRPLLTPS
ncbi:MAG: nuclear transport factor 2 family protein, partial [Pseudonocardia sp.]